MLSFMPKIAYMNRLILQMPKNYFMIFYELGLFNDYWL